MAELLHRTIYFLGFNETKFGTFRKLFALTTLGVKGLIQLTLLHCSFVFFFQSPTEEDADENVKDLVEQALKKMV